MPTLTKATANSSTLVTFECLNRLAARSLFIGPTSNIICPELRLTLPLLDPELGLTLPIPTDPTTGPTGFARQSYLGPSTANPVQRIPSLSLCLPGER